MTRMQFVLKRICQSANRLEACSCSFRVGHCRSAGIEEVICIGAAADTPAAAAAVIMPVPEFREKSFQENSGGENQNGRDFITEMV